MTTLDSLLVEIGVDANDLSSGVNSAGSDVERALADAGDAADAMGRDIVQAADEASTALDGVGTSADEAAQGAEQAAADVEGSFRGIAAAAAGAAVGGLFVSGLTSAMDAESANAMLTTQLGLTAEEAERAGTIAGDVFSQGFGESIDAVNDAIGSVASAMGGMGKVSDKELQTMTTSALTVADILGTDVSEAATAAGQMLKQGLVKDGQEGFDVLTGAAKAFPKSMLADIPAVIADYGQHFEMLGLDAQTAFGLMSQYVKAGGKDIDQAGDIIHEFARITSEESAEASKAFDAIGLSGKDMLAKIHKGGPDATAALGETIEALKNVKDPAKQSEMAVALFGDMAGEAGDALWAMDPATAAAATGMDSVEGSAKKASEAVGASKSMESIWRNISTTLGEFLAPALETVNKFMQEHPGLIKILVPLVLGLAVALGIFALANWAVNAAMLANPITWIILGIIALIAVVALIIVKWDEIKESTARTWGYIADKLGEAWDWMIGKATELWLWLSGIFSDGWNWIVKNVWNPVRDFFTKKIPGWVGDGVQWIKDKWNDMVDWFAGIPGRIASGARGMWDFISDGLKGALNGAIGLVNDGIWFINDKLIGSANMIPGVNIPYIPYIPYLAEGGVVTAPTLAMIGEGGEPEAVTPLSTLDGMLRSVAQPVQQVGREPAVLVVQGDGGAASTFVIEQLRLATRQRAGGSVVKLIEEG